MAGQRTEEQERNRKYNSSKQGRIRMMRWRAKNREAYLKYLRQYHRTRRRDALLARIEVVESVLQRAKTPADKTEAIYAMKELELKLAALRLRERRDRSI